MKPTGPLPIAVRSSLIIVIKDAQIGVASEVPNCCWNWPARKVARYAPFAATSDESDISTFSHAGAANQ